ncbi:energy transducer TonB [Acidocella sp.]|uniref:energy transducer TonB n=1 Tax=Acidocella sp. TaxID=50710 RepID=UPI003D02692A
MKPPPPRLSLVGLAQGGRAVGGSVLRARLADRLEPGLAPAREWPWPVMLIVLGIHLGLAALLLLAGRAHIPAPPEQIAINIVSETAPHGAETPQPVSNPASPAAARPVSAQPEALPLPPPAFPSVPLAAASSSPVADLPAPPPTPPPPPRPAPPKPVAPEAGATKIAARKTAATTVAVLHPAVPFADNQAPDYPAAALAAGERGVVRFKLYLGPDGRVRRFVLTQSSGYADLDESARVAAMGWRYRPAMRGGVAVAAVVPFFVNFEPR